MDGERDGQRKGREGSHSWGCGGLKGEAMRGEVDGNRREVGGVTFGRMS